MRLRTMIAMSVWFKLALLMMCSGVLYVHYAWSDYFNPILSSEEQRNAVAAAFDVDARNSQGLTGLMFSSIQGEKDLATALIDRGAHLDLVSPREKETALHYATNNLRAIDSAAVGHILIGAYANTRLPNTYGQTPLHLVISTDVLQDRQRMVDALMKNGADINAQTGQGDTLLHLAVNMAAYNWVPTLIEKYGAIMDRSIKNKKGLTPKEYAQQLGFGEMVKLVGDSANPLIGPAVYDGQGLTGLMLAIMGNNPKVVESYAKDKNALNLLSKDEYQNSPLHTALLNENMEALKALLENGALSSIQNARGEPVIQYIVRVGNPAKKIQALEMLVKKDPAGILVQNNHGDNLIHYLVKFDDQKSFEYLYRNQCELLAQALEVKNKSLETPRDLAVKFSRKVLLNAMKEMKLGSKK